MYSCGSPGATLSDKAYWIIRSIKSDGKRLNTGQASVTIWLVPKTLQREEIAGHKWVSDGMKIKSAEVERTTILGINDGKEEEETANYKSNKSHHVPLHYLLA